MQDLTFLNPQADDFYYCPDETLRYQMRQRLWEATSDLIRNLDVECSLMTRDDLTQELNARVGGWIDDYKPSGTRNGGYIGYIAANAKLATKNIFRDERPGGFSRRALEAKNTVSDLVSRGMELAKAKEKVVLDTGMGVDLYRSFEVLLISGQIERSLDAPISHKSPDISFGDTLPDTSAVDPFDLIDREQIKVGLSTLPTRYRALLNGIAAGKDPFTEVDLGAPATISEKAVLIDSALKTLRALHKLPTVA